MEINEYLIFDDYHIDETWPHSMLALYPGGWLCGIMVHKYKSMGPMHFELIDENGMALYADFTIPPQLTRGGVMLREPVPNVNAAWHYYLKLPENMCKIDVYSLNRGFS